MNYTEDRESSLFKMLDYDIEEEDYSEIINILNEEFRSMGEGIVDIINAKYNLSLDNPIGFIKNKCAENGVPIEDIGSPNKLRDWFYKNSARPKKSDSSRKSVFALAFALKLTIEETKDLFHKVYLDRAFNHRKYNELIYYYCLDRGLSYNHAEHLISMVEISDDNSSDKTMLTQSIFSTISTTSSDESLLSFIKSHPHNFSINCISAKNKMIELKQKAMKTLNKYSVRFYNSDSEDYKYISKKSESFLYDIITNHYYTGEKKQGTTTISFKSSAFPKEIKNNFPQVKSFSENNNSYEELRKVIILLFSFCFWLEKSENASLDIDDFESDLENHLSEANMPPLYYGNPYDWLFLYCTLKGDDGDSLDIFQGIISYVLDTEIETQ